MLYGEEDEFEMCDAIVKKCDDDRKKLTGRQAVFMLYREED